MSVSDVLLGSRARSLFVRCGAMLVCVSLVSASIAQTVPTTTPRPLKPYKESDTTAPPPITHPADDPGNPLVITDPPDGSDLKMDRFSPAHDFEDYRTRPDDFTGKGLHRAYPLFGYDFFKPARDFLEVRRAARLRRLLPLAPRTPASAPASRPTRTGDTSARPYGARGRAGRTASDPDNPDDSRSKAPLTGDPDKREQVGRERQTRELPARDRDRTDDPTDPARKGGPARDDGSDETSRDDNAGRRTDSGRDPADTSDPRTQDETARGGRGDTNGRSVDPAGTNDRGVPPARRPAPRPDPADDGYSDDTDGTSTGQPATSPRRTVRPNPTDQTGDAAYPYDPYDPYDPAATNQRTRTRPLTVRERADAQYADLVAGSAGQLPGEDASSSPFGSNSDIAGGANSGTAPPNYQIAPGDQLTIDISSPTVEPKHYRRTVDASGVVRIDEIGVVAVRGLTASAAERLIRTRVGGYFRNADVTVSLGRLHSIQVIVSGQAFQPGSYTLPAASDTFNALYQAGGPTFDGSMRKIEVLRSGRLAGTVDLYRFFTGGRNAQSVSLQNGDTIYIPPRNNRVVVAGEVRNQANFELLDKETVADALHYAGNAKSSGVAQRVEVLTVVPGSARVIKEVDLTKPTTLRQPLFDGDQVTVLSIRPEIQNLVRVEGAVNEAGDYALAAGMRVSDIVRRARGVVPQADTHRVELIRRNRDNTTSLVAIDLDRAVQHDPANDVVLQPFDRLRIFRFDEVNFPGFRKVTVRGAVKKPGAYTFHENMRLLDALREAGGLTPDATTDKAFVQHQKGDGTFDMETVALAGVMKADDKQNIVLQDNDIVAIYTAAQAAYQPNAQVDVVGQVVSPGLYVRTANMKLSDVIALAGGLKPGAAPTIGIAHPRRTASDPAPQVQHVRVDIDRNNRCVPREDVAIEAGDLITVARAGDYRENVEKVLVEGAVSLAGAIPITHRPMRLSDAVKAAGGLGVNAFPEGTEFYREPNNLVTAGQRDLTLVISSLSDLINGGEFKRQEGASIVERFQATNSSSDSGGVIPGLGGGAAAPNPVAPEFGKQLATKSPVSPARKFDPALLLPTGYIAVNLTAALAKPGGPDDLTLADGDQIRVPEIPTTVQVVGAVINGRGVQYRPGADVGYYVDQSGGYAADAARERIIVIHMGGGVIPGSKAHALRPGDVVFVPTKVIAQRITAKKGFFDSLFKNVASSFILLRLIGIK